MRQVAAIAALLTISSAHASFELMIIADWSSGFHRFDAETGTYLGMFGNGQTEGTLATWGSSATNRFYAMSFNGLRSWNYSTGAYLGIVNFNCINSYATNDANGNFIAVSGTAVTTFGLNGVTSGVNISGTNLQWIYRHDDGRYYMGDSNNGGRILRTTGTTVSNSVDVVASGLNSLGMPATPRHAMAHIRPGLPNIANGLYVHDSTTSDRFYAIDSNFNYQYHSGYGVSNLTTRNGAARGHYGIYHVGKTSTPGTIGISYSDDGSSTRYFTSNLISQPTSMTVILAPEPGSIVALGAGLAAMLRGFRRSVKL
ncbi:MAG: hypothetical protein IT206_09755 [Fimbriimonadaceae bacterium]|nr:hypothetical protein [Fimbriimonadaceae bacterium]